MNEQHGPWKPSILSGYSGQLYCARCYIMFQYRDLSPCTAPVAAKAPAAAGDAQPVSRADELDAARYRWLRGHFRFAADSDCEIWFDSSLKHSPADQLDAAIDAALQRTSGGDHE